MTYREARIKAGYTLETASQAIGVSKAAISIWERGEGNPLLCNLKKMAALYGVPVAELDLGNDEEANET